MKTILGKSNTKDLRNWVEQPSEDKRVWLKKAASFLLKNPEKTYLLEIKKPITVQEEGIQITIKEQKIFLNLKLVLFLWEVIPEPLYSYAGMSREREILWERLMRLFCRNIKNSNN